MAYSDCCVNSDHPSKDVSCEGNKKRSRSRSLLKSFSLKNKFVRFPSQLRIQSNSQSSTSETKVKADNDVFPTPKLRHERPRGNTEEQLRKTLFRRSLGAKLELMENQEKYSPQMQRPFSKMTKLTENKRSMSNGAILDALNEEKSQPNFKPSLSPKPSRPPKFLYRSCSLDTAVSTGKHAKIEVF